jgi:phytoene/squalene synthetase
MPATPELHSARYFALLYASAANRPALEALFGIEHEVFGSLRAGLDHHVAHSRLQWWREECERAANGRPVHPLTKGLVSALNAAAGIDGGAATASSASSASAASAASQASSASAASAASQASAASAASAVLPAALVTEGTRLAATALSAGLVAPSPAVGLPGLAGLCGIVDVAVWDLAGATFETRRELDAYCERWAAGMIEPLVAPPSASPASATQTTDWRALGAAMREVELLTDLAREAHYGRIRVPLDELECANVDTSTLAKPPWPHVVTEQLRARHESLRNNISRILIDVDREQQPALRGLLVWAGLSWRSSQRAESALPERLRPGRFDAISDAWYAWRIARRATIGRFRLN